MATMEKHYTKTRRKCRVAFAGKKHQRHIPTISTKSIGLCGISLETFRLAVAFGFAVAIATGD